VNKMRKRGDKMLRILSIDGGGIKGIVSAYVLAELESVLKSRSGNKNAALVDYFDLVAGTSTGAILALMILCPQRDLRRPKYSADDCIKLYNEKGKEIFRRSLLRRFYTIGGIADSKYPSKNIEKVLKENFRDVKMSQLLKPCLITAYDMTGRKCVFFNKTDAENDKMRDFPVADAARASSAAPTYFPPHKMRRYDGTYGLLCDGGVFANNATMCAIAQAAKMRGCEGEMQVLSIGNIADTETPYKGISHGWGIIKWGGPIIDILLSASPQIVDYQVKKLFSSCKQRGNYLRIEANEEKNIKMDDVSENTMKRLNEIGKETAERSRKSLERFAERLIM